MIFTFNIHEIWDVYVKKCIHDLILICSLHIQLDDFICSLCILLVKHDFFIFKFYFIGYIHSNMSMTQQC